MNRGFKQQKGGIVIGLILSSFLLFGIILATCDLTFALFQYLSFNNALEKGINLATQVSTAEIPNIQEISFSDSSEETIKKYVGNILEKTGFNIQNININTKTIKSGMITVSIEKKYSSLFGFFHNLSLEVQKTAFLRKNKTNFMNQLATIKS